MFREYINDVVDVLNEFWFFWKLTIMVVEVSSETPTYAQERFVSVVPQAPPSPHIDGGSIDDVLDPYQWAAVKRPLAVINFSLS